VHARRRNAERNPQPLAAAATDRRQAYDSDKLDRDLLERHGVEMIAPNRRNRNAMTQDRRALRRYKRRWRVERFFARLNNFRRLVVRWERHAANYLGFLELACVVILLRRLAG